MKKFLLSSLALVVASVALAGNGDPAGPYDDYDRAMASHKKYKMAVEWQKAAGAQIAAAVDEDKLAAFVADDAAAAALLAQVKDAYATDPTVATQVAAVSQWVMGEDPCFLCFWKPCPSDGRKVWCKALVTRAETANETYVKLLCLDQLRWCGCKCPCLVKRVRAVGEKCGDKAVKDMAEIVVKTLR